MSNFWGAYQALTTGEMTASQLAMPAAAGDAHFKVIMDNGQTVYLYPGWKIQRTTSGDYNTFMVTGTNPGFYVAYLKKDNKQWTLILNGFNGQSITYVPGNSRPYSPITIMANGENVLAPKDGGAVDANQNNYRAISCGKEGKKNPEGLAFTINGSGSLAIRANDLNTASHMRTAQCIFTQGLTIKGNAKVSIDLKLPSYENKRSHAIFTSDLYVIGNASLDIKSYNVGEIVRASAHDQGGRSHVSIDTTGTVNIEFGGDNLQQNPSRVFVGYPDSQVCVYSIDNVGYMSIARKGYRSDNSSEPDNFDFVAYPRITVSENLTVKKFTTDNIKRIQYFPVSDSNAVQVQLFDGRIQDGKFKVYDELWVPLHNTTADLTITAPESRIPFKKWVAMADNLTGEDSSVNLPVNGQPVSNETVTLYFDSPGTCRILAKYDPFGGYPKWTKGYSSIANCPTGTVSWNAPSSISDEMGWLVPSNFQLSDSSPVAAKNTSGNAIDKVESGVSVFARQGGSGITYVLPDTGAKRIALYADSRWHFSDPFVPDLDDLTLPPAPTLASLNCSNEQTPLSPNNSDPYLFVGGLIVKATNFDFSKYEMYYTYNRGGESISDPTESSPSTSNGVIVLKQNDTWYGVTNLKVRFKSKENGAWSNITNVSLQRVENADYTVTFAPEANYTQSGTTITINDPITATVTIKDPDKWPINAELVYSTHPTSGMDRFFKLYSTPVSISDAGAFRVGVRVPDPVSSSDDYSVVHKNSYIIKLDPTATKYTLTVVNGKAYQPDGSAYSTNSTGSARTYNIRGNELVEIRADPPTGGKVFENWDSTNVGVADRYSPITTLTMPTHNNLTVTANINGAPLITGETRLRMTPEDGPINALRFFHKYFGSRRMLTYDWYEGNRKLGPDDDFEAGKCYTAKVEVRPVEGAYFDSGDKLSMGLNHALGSQDILFTRVSDKLLLAEIRLLTKPVLTMELHPGDALPTAADLADQLPAGYIIDTLTWAGGATSVPSGATEMTITELKISGSFYNYHVAGGAIIIDGTAYPVSESYFNTVTLTNVTLPVKPKGVEVSGTVTSYGDAGENVTIQLIEQGASEAAYEVQVSGGTQSGNKFTVPYAFSDVPSGTYTMKVIKQNHVTREYTITVGTEAVTQDVKIHLKGDVNGDGKITMLDCIRTNSHARGVSLLTGYELQCADVMGTDGKVTMTDAIRINAHARGTAKLW